MAAGIIGHRVIANTSMPLLEGAPTAAGVTEKKFVLEADTMLISLYVAEITSGQLDVELYTVGRDGHELQVVKFPSITGPTTELLMKKAAVALSNMRLVVTYTGACRYSIIGKGLSLGETSVDILAPTQIVASQLTLTTTPTAIIPLSLEDRKGVVIKNNSDKKILYVGGTLSEANSTTGWPISPGETLAADVAAGQTIYGVASDNTVDVRILEAGA